MADIELVIKIPEVLHSRAINGELTDLDTMFICGAVAQSKPLQTELEKIKAEIIKLPKQGYFISSDGTMGGYRERSAEDFEVDVLNIFDKNISELKGENKE